MYVCVCVMMDGKLKEKQAMQFQKEGSLTLRSKTEDVKLAATAISFNVRLRSSDMPADMQEHGLRCTRSLIDSVVSTETTTKKTRPNPTHLARSLKKVLKIISFLFFWWVSDWLSFYEFCLFQWWSFCFGSGV